MAGEQDRAKSSLQTRLHDAVKQCQIRFGGKQELATSTESCIACLCSAWEAVLHHGIRKQSKNNIPSGLKQVTELTGLSRLLHDDSDDEVSLWPLISHFLPSDERQCFLRLSVITTDTGRFRAWLRTALNEHSLERQLQTILADPAQLRQHFRPGAFLLDEERTAILPSLAAGVTSIVFALDVNVPAMNSPMKLGFTVPSGTPTGSGARLFAQLTGGSANGSFDSVDDDAIVAVQVAPPLQRVARRRGGRRVGRSGSGTVAPDAMSVRSDEMIMNTGALNDTNPDLHLHDFVVVTIPNANRMHKRASSDQMVGWRVPGFSTGDRPSSRSTSTSDSIEEAEEAGQSWDEPHRLPILEGSPGPPVLEERVYEEPGSRSDGDGGVGSPPTISSSSSLSVDEMRKAMLAVIDNKDAVEEENRHLMAMLDEYKTKLAASEDEVLNLKHHLQIEGDQNQAVINDLRRENTIIKQQLREYVRSVEMMSVHRPGSQPQENGVVEENASIESVRKEVELFQVKLVQLAQMQGELLELNEHLQRTIKEKENVIQRLRNELTHLRGPLPDPSELPSGTGRSLHNGRWNPFNQPLVHLWIPMALLQRQNGAAHHVYQVYVRIGDSDEWNVYRRYADFRHSHAALRKTFAGIDRFEFPRKTIKNMREKVVESRRVKLQTYMRQVINHIIERNPQQNIDKCFLFHNLPILDDSK